MNSFATMAGMRGGRWILSMLVGALLIPAAAIANEVEYYLDAYYTAVDYYVNLTTTPIPSFNYTSEADLYKRLALTSPIPRYLLMEASGNPLPVLGVVTKHNLPRFYDNFQLSGDVNLIQSVTAGFDEPWAGSLFFGNIVNFKPVKTKYYAEGRGYNGFLVSAGSQHIQDDDLIRDNWVETEYKIKGDRIFPDVKLQWSYRLGAKFHDNPDITNVYYVGLRRSRVNYGDTKLSWLNNSGLTYEFDFSQSNLAPIEHDLLVDKKFPLKGHRFVPSVALGFVWRGANKYTGSLIDQHPRGFQLLLRPNIEF